MSELTYSPITLKDRFRGFYPVVVDVETAGFDPKTDALIEVSMMTVKMDEHGFLSPNEIVSANIRPFEGANIVQSNIDFLGIDPFDETRNLKNERDALIPMFKKISKEVKKNACSRAVLVGHNANFDLSFINAAVERLNYKRNPFHPFSVFDTASLSALVFGQTVLSRACFAAKIDFDGNKAHGSEYDTQKECELFCMLVNRFTTFAGIPAPLVDCPTPQELHTKRHENTETNKDTEIETNN